MGIYRNGKDMKTTGVQGCRKPIGVGSRVCWDCCISKTNTTYLGA